MIAQANAPLDKNGKFQDELVSCRENGEFVLMSPGRVQYMDIAPSQIVSVAASLIPFLEHDDANRALMGSNMQRQAVPCLRPEKPFVGTVVERTGRSRLGTPCSGARRYGRLRDATRIVVRVDDPETCRARSGVDIYNLTKYTRSNQNPTSINADRQKRRVDAKGDVVADGASTDLGSLRSARTCWSRSCRERVYNFEASILTRSVSFLMTAIHRSTSKIERPLRATRNSDQKKSPAISPIFRESARPARRFGHRLYRRGGDAGDVLSARSTAEGRTQLTPEEKLLRAIFGERLRTLNDTSLRVPSGMSGTVIASRCHA